MLNEMEKIVGFSRWLTWPSLCVSDNSTVEGRLKPWQPWAMKAWPYPLQGNIARFARRPPESGADLGRLVNSLKDYLLIASA